MYEWQNGDVLNEINLNKAENMSKKYIDDITGNKEDLETTDKTNLVNAINELVNKKSGNFIIATISNQHTQTVDGYQKVNMDTIHLQKGDSFTLDNGDVVIGSGVNYIRLIGKVYFYEGTTNVSKYIQIKSNDSVVSRDNYLASTQYLTFTAAETIVQVQENDRISLDFSGNQNDLIKNYPFATYLLIEVVA